MIDETTAKDILTTQGHKPSKIGEAVDVLLETFKTYQSIKKEFGRSEDFWSIRHRIYQLPEGIKWKVDEGQIAIGQAEQLIRLDNEEDQWLLAIAIIESVNLTATESRNVVNLVLNENTPIREALGVSAGIHFDKTYPLVLPLPFDTWFSICKRAWTEGKNWADHTYELILQGLEVNPEKVACQLEKLASDLRRTNRTKQDDQSKEVIDE